MDFMEGSGFFESDCDKLHNETIALIQNKEFDKAKINCERALKEFPEFIDGQELYAELYAATGQKDKAIECLEKVIQYMGDNPGFDEESIDYCMEKIKELEKQQ
jgi:tetratricopeptide (TPR) repeat protein